MLRLVRVRRLNAPGRWPSSSILCLAMSQPQLICPTPYIWICALSKHFRLICAPCPRAPELGKSGSGNSGAYPCGDHVDHVQSLPMDRWGMGIYSYCRACIVEQSHISNYLWSRAYLRGLTRLAHMILTCRCAVVAGLYMIAVDMITGGRLRGAGIHEDLQGDTARVWSVDFILRCFYYGYAQCESLTEDYNSLRVTGIYSETFAFASVLEKRIGERSRVVPITSL